MFVAQQHSSDVVVKPHGSPVLHALNYLMGRLDRDKLTQLRQFGGLQAYPSRTKDPDRVDFSTGSVGLGPAATLFAATVREYVDRHFGARPASRFYAVLGDAELDEGNVWEAVHDPGTDKLGSVTWLVDFNRQSLDRIVPDVRISPWHAAFADGVREYLVTTSPDVATSTNLAGWINRVGEVPPDRRGIDNEDRDAREAKQVRPGVP